MAIPAFLGALSAGAKILGGVSGLINAGTGILTHSKARQAAAAPQLTVTTKRTAKAALA